MKPLRATLKTPALESMDMILRLTSSTLALIVATAPAAFSLTADQVWDAWETYLTGSGYQVTVGSRDGGGDALTLKDVVLTVADETAGTNTTITLPTIRMGQTGGADVRTEYPDTIRFAFTGDSGDIGVEGTVDAASLETVSREDAGHQVDSTRAAEVVIALTRLSVEEGSFDGTPFTMTLRDLNTSNTFLGGLNVLTEGRIGGMTGAVDMTSPEGDGSLAGQFEVGATEFSSETDFPAGHDSSSASALAGALRAGAAMTGKGSFASFSLDLDISAPDNGDSHLAMTSGTGSVDFGLADGRLNYQGDITDLDYSMEGGEIPFPVQVALGAVSFDIQFPLLASEEAQPFKLAYSLGDLTLNDAIWGMIDQKGALPHDPANLDLDVTGELLVHEDLLTMAEKAGDGMGMGMDQTPISPVSFTLNQLALAAVGASATAEGTVSFPDPANVEVAVGTLEAEYKGLNGLMDKLVEAGFVSSDDVQGMRMMLMMFAKPVDGQDDTLRTRLEMKEDGSIFANGMQLK